ncbi:hypothetical protein [Streptomyces sp. NPDC058295]|uniref:hypothetical protein n=1 Tax=Streptomyces sp. NPDC058295 TaxID=3346431 RepID=UPI0036EB68D5
MADGDIPQLTRTHRVLIGVVVAGPVIIAGIGFAGSYAAVRELTLEKGPVEGRDAARRGRRTNTPYDPLLADA